MLMRRHSFTFQAEHTDASNEGKFIQTTDSYINL